MNPKFEEQKRRFEYRIKKEKSIERTIWAHLKPKHSWEEGITIEQIRDIVIKEKKKKYTKNRIYQAISDIDRFGSRWGLYIKSDYGWVDTIEGKKKEFRYFTPIKSNDIEREFSKLSNRKGNVNLREQSLEYHEKVTIPQEQKIEQIRQK